MAWRPFVILSCRLDNFVSLTEKVLLSRQLTGRKCKVYRMWFKIQAELYSVILRLQIAP